MTEPPCPEISRMKRLKKELKLDEIAGILEDLAQCKISYELIHGNGPLLEKFTRECLEEFSAFLLWVDEHLVQDAEGYYTLCDRNFDVEAPLYPSEWLFAAYAGIDLDKVEDEKQALLRYMRGCRG
jgi:hypothetical protein